jgi:isoleucyl-tRNA synthetase
VRRSRDSFWGRADSAVTRAAFATLHETLVTVARLLAPITPFHGDWLHRALMDGASAHLARFPGGEGDERMASLRDPELERGMESVRELSRLGRAARERVRIRVRQPLRTAHAFLPGGRTLDDQLLAVLKDELNLKEVRFLQRAEELVTLRAQPSFRAIGKRFGSSTQEAAGRIRALTSDSLVEFRNGGSLAIEVGGETFALGAEDFDILEEGSGDLVIESEGGHTIALDPAIDDELRLEGLARELVNRVQRLRRESGLDVSDRVRVGVAGDDALIAALNAHGEYVAGEVLAVAIEPGADISGEPYTWMQDVEMDGVNGRIGLGKA